MKKFILSLTVVLSFVALSCEPEDMDHTPIAEIENDVRVYSDTGNQADTTDKKGDD